MFSSVQSSNSSGRVIIVNIHTTVVKILGIASLIALLWNGCRGCPTCWKTIFDKNCLPGLLMWKFVRDWSALLLDCVFFPLHWSYTTRGRISNEITENKWHLPLLFHRRPLVVGLNCPDGLASRYAIMVVQRALTDVALRQWFVRCGSVYACSLWQEVRFKTRFCRLRDWTSCFDHLLVSETEHPMLDWDGSGSPWAFLLDIFHIPRWKISSHSIHLQHLRGQPGDFCSQ